MNAICVQNLRYQINGKTILDGVDLGFGRGKLYGVIGRNGSGKSTLFRAILGYAKSSGKISICGNDARKLSAKALARLVAYIPQKDDICFGYTALQIVQMGASDGGIVAAALKRVGASTLQNQPYTSLSGGERQMVLIARAIAMQTPIMVLDEPTSALDLTHQMMVWQLLKSLSNDGKTIIICTHEPNYAMWFCDEFVIVQDKNALQTNVLDDDLVRRIYGDGFAIMHIMQGSPASNDFGARKSTASGDLSACKSSASSNLTAPGVSSTANASDIASAANAPGAFNARELNIICPILDL